MSTCPVGSITGFVNLAGTPTTSRIESILVKGSPLTINFAPRTTPPSLVGNLINEDSGNTILYKGTQYSLQSAQIAMPSHGGYVNQTQAPILELSLTFWNPQVVGTYPTVILFIVPIMAGNEDVRAVYLQQLMNADVAATSIASLQDMFGIGMASYGYKTCIDLAQQQGQEGTPSNLAVYVLYFLNGIVLTQQEAVTLQALVTPTGGQIPPYQIPPSLLNGMSTVQAFEIADDGSTVPTSLSSQGVVGSQQLSSNTDEFINVFQYFIKPPTVGSSPGASCPSYTTSQYKCLPFNQFKDLSGNLVNSVTLQDRIAATTNSAPDINFFTSNAWSIILDILAVIMGLMVVGSIIYVVTGKSAPVPPIGAGAGAGAGAGTGAGAGAGAGAGPTI